MTKRFPSIFSFSKLAIVAVAAMVVFGSASWAYDEQSNPYTARKFLKAYKEGKNVPMGLDMREYAKLIVGNVGESFGWANSELRIAGTLPLYCPPPELGISQDQYMSILRQEVEKFPYLAKYPLHTILLDGLIRTFPCK